MNDDWISRTAHTDPVWLDMLVDDELTVDQRTAYLRHIAQQDAWQQVATAFLDEQVLRREVRFEPVTTTEPTAVPTARWKPVGRMLLGMVTCLVGGLLLGRAVFGTGDRPEVIAQDESQAPNAPAYHPIAPTPDPGPEKPDVALPALFQVQNTIDEAVFYADYSVPQFLLDALIIAGHEVDLQHEFVGYTQSLDDPTAVPINVIRIQKYGRLLAAANNAAPTPPE